MFSFTKDIGMDLGTASVLIYIKDKGIVLNEPSVVALDKNTGKLLKVGADAQAMLGRTPGNIIAIRPLREGVISDYEVTERMIKEFLHKVMGFQLFKPRIIICVPSGITEVEERAVIDAGTYSLMLALGWPIWLSRAISFILGTSTSYLLNRKLTFHGANTGNTTAKAGAFALVYIVTFFVNWGTNQLLTTLTHAQGNSLLLGICWVVGQGLGTLINFVMLKWVVFRE